MAAKKEQKPFGGAKLVCVAKIMKESVQDKNNFGALNYHEHPVTQENDDTIAYYGLTVDYNAYHARCLRVKSDITVGLGMNITEGDEQKMHDRLAVINEYGESFQDVLNRVSLDYETTGNGYLEIVRGATGLIVEIYFMPAERVYKRPRGSDSAYYYLSTDTGQMIPMKQFSPDDTDAGSSLLHFTNYTQTNKHYGLPDWRGCMPDIELDYYATLYNKKFFVNCGIPDMAIIVEGGSFDKDTQDAVTSLLQSNIKGYVNAHRTLYLPINDANVKVRFERLGMEIPKDASFDQLRSRCRDNIVSAHGVYPRLVGIVTAGQLGGGGEASGQLKTFQEITINPRQSMFEAKLKPVLNGMGEGTIDFAFEKMDTSIQESDSVYYPAMVSAGILTVEKAREKLGYEADMPGDEERKLDLEQKRQQQDEMNKLKQVPPELKLVQNLEEIRKAL